MGPLRHQCCCFLETSWPERPPKKASAGCAMLVQYVYGLRAHNSFKCVYSSHIADFTFSTWPQILPCADNRRGQQAHGHRDRQLSPRDTELIPGGPNVNQMLVELYRIWACKLSLALFKASSSLVLNMHFVIFFGCVKCKLTDMTNFTFSYCFIYFLPALGRSLYACYFL